MKRAFLLAILLAAPLWAYADDPIWSVFEIQSYKYNPEIQSFSEIQYGSAVYAGSGTIYTNAHVILDDDNKPLGNYEVCKTTDFKKPPVCFSVGELLYFDTEKDLAVLKIKDPKVKAVNFSAKNSSIGDSIKVYGYPANGGDTISYTEGKVSGFEKEMYKIDANVDSGNSGGGVFDKNGNLIGIATSVSVGYTTMGYIIPTATLKDFIAKKTPNHIEKYSQGIDPKFKSYSERLQNAINSNRLVTKDVALSPLGSGFFVKGYVATDAGDIFSATLKNKKETVRIFLSTLEYNGYTPSLQEIAKKAKQSLDKRDDLESVTVTSSSVWGKDAVVITMIGKEDQDAAAIIFVQYGSWKYLQSLVFSKYKADVDFKKAISLVLKKTVFNKNISSGAVTSNYSINNLTYKDFGKFSAVKSAETMSLGSVAEDIEVEYSSYVNSITEYKDVTLADFTTSFLSSVKESAYINTAQIRKTGSGQYYIYTISKNNESRESATVKKNVRKYRVNVVFFSKKSDDVIRQHIISFTFDSKESLKAIDAFIEGISVNTPFPFEVGKVESGKNLIEKPEFEVQ